MDTATKGHRGIAPARLVLVLAAIVGVLGMHALVVATPSHAVASHAGSSAHDGHTLAATLTPSDAAAGVLAVPVGSPEGSGHGPGDHSGIAHLCLALAAAIFLLLIRRLVLGTSLVAPPGPSSRVGIRAMRRTRPPPDLVAALCVSRS